MIVTHCHWDHIGNLDLFAQRGAASCPSASSSSGRRRSRATPSSGRTRRSTRSRRSSGRGSRIASSATGADEEIVPGVRVITVGGHSPGQQIVVVDGNGDPRLRRRPSLRGARARAAVRRRRRPARDGRGLRADQGARRRAGRGRRPGPRPAGGTSASPASRDFDGSATDRTDDAPGIDGRVALVTGGASGIGAATVRRLSAEGASRRDRRSRRARPPGAVAASLGGPALAIGADVSVEDDVDAMIERARRALRPRRPAPPQRRHPRLAQARSRS